MNCQDALNLLYDIIDKEASDVDTQAVREHLEKCRDCFEVYRLESSINEFLSERIKGGNPVTAHESLKSKIMGRLDEVDEQQGESGQDNKSQETNRPFRLPVIALVAAASLVVLLGATFLGSHFSTHQSRFIPLEQAHWAMADSPTTLSNENTQLLLTEAKQKFAYDLEPAIGTYHLAGGQQREILDAEMLHYVYLNNGSHVSVFLAPAAWFDGYQDLDMEEAVRDNIRFFDHNCRGCRLVFHRDGDAVIITATTDREIDLLEFIPGHSAI